MNKNLFAVTRLCPLSSTWFIIYEAERVGDDPAVICITSVHCRGRRNKTSVICRRPCTRTAGETCPRLSRRAWRLSINTEDTGVAMIQRFRCQRRSLYFIFTLESFSYRQDADSQKNTELSNINNVINLNVPCHTELQGRLILVRWPESYRRGSLNKKPLRFFSLSVNHYSENNMADAAYQRQCPTFFCSGKHHGLS